jgi:hypothetical protein
MREAKAKQITYRVLQGKAAPVCQNKEECNDVNSTDITTTLETALSKLLPGKHVSTKEKFLVEAILSGKLYELEIYLSLGEF